MNTIIKLNNIFKQYKNKGSIKTTANNLNLEILENDRLGIIGKNGVGKTTLINMILGKTKPNKGKVEISNKLQNRFYDIAYLPQEFLFPKFFKVREIFHLIMKDTKFQGLFDKEWILKIIHLTDIDNLYHKKYKSLSGGEKQKINLFSILACKPKIIFLDEFSNSIDLETNLKIREFLIQSGITVVIVSHNTYEISSVCNKIICLNEGLIFKSLQAEKFNESDIVKIFEEVKIATDDEKEKHKNTIPGKFWNIKDKDLAPYSVSTADKKMLKKNIKLTKKSKKHQPVA
ncbi:ATP-binding cassette domain-containing protein [[Mycoplasma] testudinis]|uniref:ATP-binding cassette domain-containing protein n=1 Tax=[Mycoplasma] testudinis TaxID=33924 RepID=UPI0004853562|nr:ABC transporter ATP-binding protein [[Mycoplasma] testudinis]